jgi:membrane associated rhomboid family serine protease
LIPIGDDNSGHTIRPYINYLLIAINIFVFVHFQRMGADVAFTNGYSTVPAEILTGHDIVTDPTIYIDQYTGRQYEIPGLMPTNIPVWLTLVTSMFMHGGFAHLGGNMLYLWVFGDNIENRLGHRRYLLFYLLAGIIASASHVAVSFFSGQNLLIPSLGASGAISGVLGAYILLFPLRKVHIFLFITIIRVPALLALGFWIFFQIVNGLGIWGHEPDGVAYAAHIGGFAAGLITIKMFDKKPGKKSNRFYR